MNSQLESYIANKGIEKIRIIIDSRNSISQPEDAIFIAIKGKYNDGHKYINDVYNQGVRVFIVNNEFDADFFSDAIFFQVDDTLITLHDIARFKRCCYKIPIIAITGSNGKTIVKEWLSYLLEDEIRVTKSPKSYNSQVGVPLSVWKLDKNSEIGIFEAGISHVGEMAKLEKIIMPTIGVLTNIGDAHQINFSTVEEKIREKIKLFINCETIIYCSDNQLVDTIIKETYPTKELVTWSVENDLYCLKNPTIWNAINKKDSTSIYNLMLCYLVLNVLKKGGYNINYNNLAKKVGTLPQIEMRLGTLDGIQNSVIINDSYNSDINSIEIALDYLNNKNIKGHEKVLILSDIYQPSDKNIYHTISQLINNQDINYFIGIGQELSNNINLFPKNSKFYSTTDDFLTKINEIDFSNKTILIKGARNFHFEKIVSKLQRQNHESVLEINLSKVKQNYDFFKSLVSQNTKIIGMVKAFAYGNGHIEIAKLLQFNQIDYLAVAISDEGIELRNNGIKVPIMIMNPSINYLNSMIINRLEPVIYSIDLLKKIIRELSALKQTDFPIHIKIDTGMHRLGFSENDLNDLCEIINLTKNIKISSIFSHLVGADDSNLDYFTHKQIHRFTTCYDYICQKTHQQPLRHILNSAGTLRFPEYAFEMIRIGIGLYGLMPELTKNISPVATLKSIISQIHEIPIDETVGYGRHGKINKKTVIATIPIGYADGLNRKLGNGNWHFIVNGQNAKIIGNICMDMCMLDITDIAAKEGDEVIILGNENPVCEMAKILKTIPYEVITSISQRIKRVYLEE